MTFKVAYPPNAGKLYSMNAIYAGKHWTERSKDKELWHSIVRNELRKQKVPEQIFDKPVKITFSWHDNLDIDNHSYMAKMIIDAIKGYLIKDDNKKWFKEVTHKFHDKPYISVELTEIEDIQRILSP